MVNAVTAEAHEVGKLRWRCRRGMRELDVILSRYLEEQYSTALPAHRQAFRELLDSQDPMNHDYVLGRLSPADAVLAALIEQLTAGSRNDRY